MDKFVVKRPRTKDSSPIKSPKKSKQLQLRDLKRVVNIDDIKRYKAMLDLPKQSDENILEALTELQKKIPPRHVFQSTQIGKSVKKFRKSENETIRELAKKICNEWNSFFVNHQQKGLLEVKCDLKTEKFREKAATLLSEVLEIENNHILVENIEREIFHQSKRLMNNVYKKATRTMVMKLKTDSNARQNLLDGTINVKEFVSLFVKKGSI
ncbi:transcription elongation factor A N-terminal and central domain-containing protein 2-like [Tubulanus polymorphus]|uniref:transcription elongation factor A N-terminal and central domain-containing protein 2-like n=1 Tax=Tubulanus polymorphus TaxID=672921 RepID=UPI003DA6AEAD